MSFHSMNITSSLGERFFAQHLIERGYLVYGLLNGFICPRCNEQSFGVGIQPPFDFLCYKPLKNVPFDFHDCFIAEIKTKVRKWENENGFNMSDFNTYKNVHATSPFDFWIVFVDGGEMYGTTMKELIDKELHPKEVDGVTYPKKKTYHHQEGRMTIEKDVIIFPLKWMKKMGKLTENQQKKLQNASAKQSVIKMSRADTRA